MLKKILAAAALLLSLSSFAAVDVNKANAAELDGIKGIGPSLSGKILKERNKGNFKDWPDLMHRVSGMGEKSSVKFSAQGLTVNGTDYKGSGTSEPAHGKMADKPKAAKP
jgi:competence protein ComEA